MSTLLNNCSEIQFANVILRGCFDKYEKVIIFQRTGVLLFGSEEELRTGPQTAECSPSPAIYLKPIKVERPVRQPPDRQAFYVMPSLRGKLTAYKPPGIFQCFHMFCEIKGCHVKGPSVQQNAAEKLLCSICVGDY